MPVAQLIDLITAAGGKRLSRAHSVWRLSAPWWPFSARARRFDELRAEIISTAVDMPGPCFLSTAENPQHYDVGGPWAHAAENTWPIPRDCDAGEMMRKLLCVGPWHIYLASVPVAPSSLPDTFRMSPGEIAEFALERSIPVLIHSRRGNSRWRILVEPASARSEIAA